MAEIFIREETAKDREEVEKLVYEAFLKAPHRDGHEQDLVRKLRLSASYIPELSLVAVSDERICGHILFTKAKINDKTVLALAPLSVLPEFQRQGIGSALIRKGHERARDLGFTCSIVLGDPEYYGKFGYVPAKSRGILAPFDVEDKYFMCRYLTDLPQDISGVIQYDKAFGI